MTSATTVILTLNTVPNQVFTSYAITARLNIDGGPDIVMIYNSTYGDTTAVFPVTNLPSLLSPGSHTFDLRVVQFAFALQNSPNLANFSFDFDSDPQTITPLTNFTSVSNFYFVGNITATIACLHGSSLIQMKDGIKRIDQIKDDDQVLSGANLDQYAKVKGVAYCWLAFQGVDHDAIIFEANSLGENEPSSRLIIDPGHPMCTKAEYLEKGYEALRPAGTFWEELKGDTVYTKKWSDLFVQEEPSRRYDLILEEPFNTYVANGMVVRAKGYKDHRYKQFV